MTLRTRQPTGIPPWPLILIEGPEKSGKSWQAAQFTASDKIGQAYWLDLGEGAADEYAAIPGAKYLVIDHDGSWQDILQQVTDVYAVAEKAQANNDPPVVLVIDSMTAEWDMLKDWTSKRALESKFARRKLAEDPNAEVKPSQNLWNDASERHYKLMRLLMRFPGICIITARGKEVSAMGDDGKPIPNQKDYRVEGQKNLPYDASVWIRLSRDEHPQVIGCRSVKAGVQPGVDRPIKRPDLTIEHVVFDVLGLDASTAHTRELTDLVSDERALADQARAALREWCLEHHVDQRAVAARFHEERGEELKATLDAQAVLTVLGELKQDHAAEQEAS